MKNSGQFILCCVFLGAGILSCSAKKSNHAVAKTGEKVSTTMVETMFEETVNTVAPENVGESMLKKLSTQDSVHGEHLLGQELPQDTKEPIAEGY